MGCDQSFEAQGSVRQIDQRELVDNHIFVSPLGTSGLPYKKISSKNLYHPKNIIVVQFFENKITKKMFRLVV